MVYESEQKPTVRPQKKKKKKKKRNSNDNIYNKTCELKY